MGNRKLLDEMVSAASDAGAHYCKIQSMQSRDLTHRKRFDDGLIEGGKIKGLGFIPGEIHQIEINENIQIPHIGWNSVNFKFEHKILSGIKNNVDFYFVHSYFFKSPIKKNILAESKYGKFFFPAIIHNKNVVGVQFHPEKSQKNGLKIIENFCSWDGS